MSMFAKLLGMEWIKLRKRSVFWVAIVVHATVLAIALGGQQYMHHLRPGNTPFTLPKGWVMLISVGTQVGMLMLFIAIALLTASEATWRTQRQNVIDGLSRGQYFSAKVLVVVILALILWIEIPLIGLIIAPFGGAGSISMPLLSPVAERMLPNALLYFAGIGATAFMFGMVASSSGAALGLLFAFIIIEPILRGVMAMQSGAWPAIANYLPLSIFANLVQPATYAPEAQAQMNAAFIRAGRPLPPSLHASMIATVIYAIAFVAIAWLAFRKRDL